MKRSDIEIMAPAGSYESLHAAIDAGANSVYFGVGRLNMRAQSAANFTLEDMGQIVSIAREHGVKSYLTVNTVIYDEEIETLHATIDRACEVGVDAKAVQARDKDGNPIGPPSNMPAASAWPYISPRKATSPTSKPSGSSPNGRT